ncbi:hypothetical protein ABT116_24235 [Streptomyces sp. NPDC002130]|uniref:hypothetical protein n=1 Tax=Streptomyces sp. NPDC002130 TaxID=3155568 RepID=UPI00331C87D0
MRQGAVKAVAAAVRDPSTSGPIRPPGAFLEASACPHTSLQESAMADPAFVITVLAAFALVALVAKGVTKL